jgi:hypothetical protein
VDERLSVWSIFKVQDQLFMAQTSTKSLATVIFPKVSLRKIYVCPPKLCRFRISSEIVWRESAQFHREVGYVENPRAAGLRFPKCVKN